MRRRRRGVVRVDEVVFENVKYPIMLNKHYGDFAVEIAETELEDKDLAALREKALNFLNEMSKNRDWEAVIEVQLEEHSYGYNLHRFKFSRYFRCKLPSGTWIFGGFKGRNDSIEPEDLKPVLGGVMSKYLHESHIFIPYSPEVWKGCIRIEKLKDELDELIFETLSGAKGSKLPEKLAEMSRAKLRFQFPMPKKAGRE